MLGGSAFPHCWLESTIQQPYFTEFDSIWEYKNKFGSIDWSKIQKDLQRDGCPICKRKDCSLRRIKPYCRRVIELLPEYREGVIWVARFQCRDKMKTVSLLPVQLAPYLRYTTASMLFALLVAERCAREHGLSLFSVAEKEIEENSRINGCTLAFWLAMTVGSLRRNHAMLSKSYQFDSLAPGSNQVGHLFEVAGYCRALGIRGPPQIGGLDAVVKTYACATGRFLIGVASQHRRGTRES